VVPTETSLVAVEMVPGREKLPIEAYAGATMPDLTAAAMMPMLVLTGPARRWEPKRLRLRLFSTAAQLVTTGRRRVLRLPRHWPWTDVITTAFTRLQVLPKPG
ncbi:MAG TPA: transposase, partial [Pseudonocardia sp.]|nr:transposase [Pseudonocardia sp.]